jgi:hypothetical protein
MVERISKTEEISLLLLHPLNQDDLEPSRKVIWTGLEVMPQTTRDQNRLYRHEDQQQIF